VTRSLRSRLAVISSGRGGSPEKRATASPVRADTSPTLARAAWPGLGAATRSGSRTRLRRCRPGRCRTMACPSEVPFERETLQAKKISALPGSTRGTPERGGSDCCRVRPHGASLP
jgi:hypothetical protein